MRYVKLFNFVTHSGVNPLQATGKIIIGPQKCK